MSELPDFDALALDAHQGHTRIVGERAFVTAALSIEAWYMIGVAPSEAPDELEPLIAPVQNAPHVLVFTDEERAEAFARARAEKRSEPSPAPVLHATPIEAVEYLESLREAGVQGAHFNDGKNAVTCDSARISDLAKSRG